MFNQAFECQNTPVLKAPGGVTKHCALNKKRDSTHCGTVKCVGKRTKSQQIGYVASVEGE